MSAPAYFARENLVALDGTRIFQTADDRASEEAVADVLARAWKCEIRHFADLSPLDWYGIRHNRIVGVLELKCRSHPIDKFPTVFLSVRKWLALQFASLGLAVPGIFVVQFADVLRWIPVADVDARAVRLAGGVRRIKSASDTEPLIEVPIAQLRAVSTQDIP